MKNYAVSINFYVFLYVYSFRLRSCDQDEYFGNSCNRIYLTVLYAFIYANKYSDHSLDFYLADYQNTFCNGIRQKISAENISVRAANCGLDKDMNYQ